MTDRRSHGAGSAAAQERRMRRLSICLSGLVLALTFAAPFAAQAAEKDRSRFSIFVEAAPHVVVQHSKGSVSTNFGIASDKHNILTNMTFRLGGGLKGPAIEPVWGKPRPVIWAAALLPLNESSTIGTNFIETSQAGAERLEFSKYAIEYQTSAVAGLGLEFIVPVFDWAISITPGIESLHLAARYTGTVNLETQRGLVNQSVGITAKKQLTQHFLGPVLRVGTPPFVFRGVTIDFSLDVSLLMDIAGTRREFAGSLPTGEAARFSFEAGSGVVQIGSGIQLRWP